MLLFYSQISMRPLCSDMLFKYLHLKHCSDVSFHFWKFHGVLGSGLSLSPEKWHKIRSRSHKTTWKIPQLHACLVVGATGGSQLHA